MNGAAGPAATAGLGVDAPRAALTPGSERARPDHLAAPHEDNAPAGASVQKTSIGSGATTAPHQQPRRFRVQQASATEPKLRVAGDAASANVRAPRRCPP